jgi:hypothetical protein
MLNPNWFPNAQKAKPTPGKFEDGMDYSQRLFHYAYASQTDELHIVENRLLQRLNIFHLQNKLAKLKGAVWGDMSASDDDLDNLKSTLHDYSEYLYMPLSLRSLTFKPMELKFGNASSNTSRICMPLATFGRIF